MVLYAQPVYENFISHSFSSLKKWPQPGATELGPSTTENMLTMFKRSIDRMVWDKQHLIAYFTNIFGVFAAVERIDNR